MYEQLDNDFIKRVGEVFEDIQSPSANEGWLKLLEKFPEKKKEKIAFFWYYWGAAAVLFLFLGISYLFYTNNVAINNNKDNYSKNSNNKHKIQKVFTDSVPENTSVKRPDILLETDKKVNANHNYLKTENKISKTKSEANSKNIIAVADLPKASIKKQKNLQQPNNIFAYRNNNLKQKKNKSTQEQDFVVNDVIDETNAGQLVNNRNPDDLSPSFLPATFVIDLSIYPVSLNPKNILEQESSIFKMFASTPQNKTEENSETDKKTHFGIYEATYLNYAKGSDNQVNLGLGVSSDIYLSKKLKLSTGLSIAKNSLAYSGSSTLNASQTNFAAATLASTMPATYNNFSPATSFKNYTAGLLGLEVPVNLKYDLVSGNNNVYIAAGVSSGTFINETYTYQYGFSSASIPFNQQTQGNSTSKSFDGFYFAKTLNLAFGVGLPFGKKRFVAEPFLKYPIGGLGSQNILFGAGGLNVKLKF